MRRALFIVAISLAVLGGGCGAGSPATCNLNEHCGASQVCIEGGHCATTCLLDGGGDCPSGTSCGVTSVYCEGGACSAVRAAVCLEPDGTP